MFCHVAVKVCLISCCVFSSLRYQGVLPARVDCAQSVPGRPGHRVVSGHSTVRPGVRRHSFRVRGPDRYGQGSYPHRRDSGVREPHSVVPSGGSRRQTIPGADAAAPMVPLQGLSHSFHLHTQRPRLHALPCAPHLSNLAHRLFRVSGVLSQLGVPSTHSPDT